MISYLFSRQTMTAQFTPRNLRRGNTVMCGSSSICSSFSPLEDASSRYGWSIRYVKFFSPKPWKTKVSAIWTHVWKPQHSHLTKISVLCHFFISYNENCNSSDTFNNNTQANENDMNNNEWQFQQWIKVNTCRNWRH